MGGSPLSEMTKADKLEYLKLLEEKERRKQELPHLHLFKDYQFAWDFKNTEARMRFLTAANQLGKSSTAITDAIEKAGNPECWDKFFKIRKPKSFYYIYPNKTTVNVEVQQKWIGEYLPKGSMKDHPTYGWRVEKYKGDIDRIEFNSGVTIYFRTWGVDLQSVTLDAAYCDEELPVHLFDEIMLRLSATDGMFAHVFTATQSQRFWYEVIELRGKKNERFPEAFKRQVSLWDCIHYADGTPSPWTEERIKKRESQCSSENERLRRVDGRFIMDESYLTYPSFNWERNAHDQTPIPTNYNLYSGVDLGSGGRTGHDPAICFIAVRPDYRFARAVMCWRGPDDRQWTYGDVLQKYIELRQKYLNKGFSFAGEYYDWAAKDFELQAQRAGLPFMKADKSKDSGEASLNTAFKNRILQIDVNSGGQQLRDELENLRKDQRKSAAKDNLIDALRYAFTRIPIDWSVVGTVDFKEAISLPKVPERVMEARDGSDDIQWGMDDEIEFWNDQMEGF